MGFVVIERNRENKKKYNRAKALARSRLVMPSFIGKISWATKSCPTAPLLEATLELLR